MNANQKGFTPQPLCVRATVFYLANTWYGNNWDLVDVSAPQAYCALDLCARSPSSP
jgi:hypothetical protein